MSKEIPIKTAKETTFININKQLDLLNSLYGINNYYLMMVEKQFIENYENWFLLWEEHKDGYYEITGNKVFVVESPLNKVVIINNIK